jgi:hypothetical protein
MEIDKKLVAEIVTALDYYIKNFGETQLWQRTTTRTTLDVLKDLEGVMKT